MTIFELNGNTDECRLPVPETWNWREALNIAIKHQPKILDVDDVEILQERARSWFSCACGKLDSRIPRKPITRRIFNRGEPEDPVLVKLGRQFYEDIVVCKYAEALILIDLIEAREKELLAELNKPTYAYA